MIFTKDIFDGWILDLKRKEQKVCKKPSALYL
jgi:hypothetical protein